MISQAFLSPTPTPTSPKHKPERRSPSFYHRCFRRADARSRLTPADTAGRPSFACAVVASLAPCKPLELAPRAAPRSRSFGGGYGAYAHRCGGPLSSRPLSPCPYNAAVPKGPALLFLKLLRRDEEVNNATRRSVRLDHSLTNSKFGVVARRRSRVRARRVRSACSCALPRSAAPRHCHGLHTWLVTTRQLAACGVACLCLDLVISSLAWGITGTT